jgi:hypothetical protein
MSEDAEGVIAVTRQLLRSFLVCQERLFPFPIFNWGGCSRARGTHRYAATEVIPGMADRSKTHILEKSFVGQRTPFRVEGTAPHRHVSSLTMDLARGSSGRLIPSHLL